ncbi:Phosphoenolpyruvate carboxykinase [GTP], mitochondrial [Anas platyrhynchos]|uniref:Phosphoenolpyruvate carboxykinase [GTP], mitochondrial n=1 Tax=Anas platyrhynchos TaxID=8839 RepID=R0J723_ANAPL|nr:Phosphoenolpyruvate carboxykinase [GTP], mitochondrial [Anas platyrhynchos]
MRSEATAAAEHKDSIMTFDDVITLFANPIMTSFYPKTPYKDVHQVGKEFWEKEARELRAYYEENFGEDLPREVMAELEALEGRLKKM